MANTLESLLDSDWVQKDTFAGYIILAKENQRLLYDPKKDIIHLKYEVNKEVIENVR